MAHNTSRPLTFLCVSTFFKGVDFIKACKAAGNTVYLVTAKQLEHEAWPRESIDEIFYVENDANTLQNFEIMEQGMAYIQRTRPIDRIVALDDFDVEKAAFLRESFRIPGMGQTTARHFRDKLAMRMKAAEAGINVPPFTALFSDNSINEFIRDVPAPWVVKPRGEASATGIKKVNNGMDLWKVINDLGEERHNYLVEQFKPGAVYHVDSLTVDGKPKFSRVSQYLNTPFEVAHGGGVFLSSVSTFGGDDDKALQKMNREVLKAFGMQFSASHTEFIKSHEDGQFYFLETSSRVGGAHLAEMVEASSGINLWAEWAKIETAMAKGETYKLPKVRKDYAGILVSLSRFQHPDMSGFDDSEIVWKMQKEYHVGMIVRDKKRARVLDLLQGYAKRVFDGFHAAVPAPEKSVH
ncbi:MAG: ATPase [Bacteroidota bacterium]